MQKRFIIKKAFSIVIAIFVIFFSSIVIITLLKLSTYTLQTNTNDIIYQKLKVENQNQIAIIKDKIINQNIYDIEYIENGDFISKVNIHKLDISLTLFQLHITSYSKIEPNIKIFKKVLIKK
jgi:hypothetical protein